MAIDLGMIDSQEEQIEDNQELIGGDRGDNLEDLSVQDGDNLHVNLVTLDNLDQQDKGDRLEIGNLDHSE